jgi:hypothetical protein
MVANAGAFFTKVLYEKVNDGKRFVIVDGGMNDLLRIPLYNTYHKIALLDENKKDSSSYFNNFKNSKIGSKCNVVGPVCESGDFFAKGIYLPKTKKSDIICVYSAGAYGFCMASNYNQRVKPAEVAIYTIENNKQNASLSSRQIIQDNAKDQQGKKLPKISKVYKDKLIKERESFNDLLKGQVEV